MGGGTNITIYRSNLVEGRIEVGVVSEGGRICRISACRHVFYLIVDFSPSCL